MVSQNQLKRRRNEGVEMFMCPDNHVQNNPYKILFGQEELNRDISEAIVYKNVAEEISKALKKFESI
ncbi:MAG: hypothetical protein ACM3X1_01985 [Ignavibacteriales bacterium]